MSSKNKQQTEIKPIEAEIMSEETLGIDAPEIIEAEVIEDEDQVRTFERNAMILYPFIQNLTISVLNIQCQSTRLRL